MPCEASTRGGSQVLYMCEKHVFFAVREQNKRHHKGENFICFLFSIFITPHNYRSKAVSYEEYFRQTFGGLGVLPVFWSSQERLTRNIFRKYFSPKYYSGNISQKSAPRQIFRAQIFLGQQIFSQQIFGGVAVTSKHVG